MGSLSTTQTKAFPHDLCILIRSVLHDLVVVIEGQLSVQRSSLNGPEYLSNTGRTFRQSENQFISCFITVKLYGYNMGSLLDPVQGIDRLSSGQLDVLKLVAQYKSSKEIGRELGISNHTVDQRIKRIQAILNVQSRAEAARVFVAAKSLDDASDVWGDLVYQSSELSEQPFASITASSSGEWNPADDGGSSELREAQAHYFAGDYSKLERPSWVSVLIEASKSNELTPTARTVVIVLIMLTSLLTLSALIGLAEGISRIF